MQASTELVTKMKKRFFANLFSKDSKYNSVLMTKRKYDSIIEDVKRIKVSKKKESSRDYRIIQRYDVLTVQGCEKLIAPLSDVRESVKKFVHAEELFDILYSTHLSIGHGGRDRMIKQLNTLYTNITQAQIKMFLDLCEPCQQKQKSAKKGIVVKPIISSHFNCRCQVDLIDFQSQPDGKFKFLLVYQDHLTKFVVLKPLTSKQADEVAYNLLDIFLLFGAPSILHSDNGREFCNKILESVTQLWPEIKMVNGKPRHSQSQGSVERANQDIENMLTTWMADNQTNKWSEGVRFVQFMKNRAYHSAIKRSPYEAMFGCPAKVGLSSIIPQSVLHSINTEEDLEKLEDSQETLIMGSQSNLTQEDIPLSPASTESPIEIQEYIDSNLKLPSTPLIEDTVMKNIQLPCTSKESPLHVEEVITELPSTSAESPSQFRTEPVKRTIQDMDQTPLSEDCSYPVLMNMDWTQIDEKILDLTLEIISLLTGEDQVVAKKFCECVEHNRPHRVTEGSYKTESLSAVTSRSLEIHEREKDKILELTNQIIQLLTGEVPIRCEDVTVYFSMEEWEYLEGHKDLYKDLIKENHQILSSLDKPLSGEYHTPDCVPEFGNNEESVAKPKDGPHYLQTSKVRKRLKNNTPYMWEESPPCTDENHRDMDIYKETEYPSTDIKKESTLHEEGNLTGLDIHACTDNTQTEYSSILIKEESASDEEGNRPGVDIYKSSHNSTLADSEDNRTCSNIHSIKPCIELNTPYHIDGNATNIEEIFLFSHCPQDVNSDTQDVKHQPTHTGKYVLSTPDPVIHEMNPKGENQISSPESRPDFIQMSNLVKQEMDWTEHKPYICSECGKYFTQAAQLASHKMVHSKERPYKCTECSKNFKRKHHLVNHRKIHTGEKPFKCTECGKCFTSNSQLISHKWIHSGERRFKCYECGKCFILKHHLISHQMVHSGEKPFKCTECGKGYTRATSLASHKLIHTGEKPFSCSECGKSFTQAAHLASHKMVHNKEKLYKCTECSKSFNKKKYLVRHQKIHTGEKPFKCTECGKCFTLNSQLISHKWIHSGERRFKCNECGKCFTLKHHLISHQMVHSKEKSFNCTECRKSFSRATSLATHKLIHTGEKPFSCSECGQRFNLKHVLKMHQRVHTGEKPYRCLECGESFTRLTSLVSHKRTHTGERPFKCSECGKGFTRATNLASHKLIHTGEKPFSCSECRKRFYSKHDLNRHHRVHTGEKPYRCLECGKGFSRLSSHKLHKKIHTR
ncbi:zinc finger protein 420-like [Pelobates fuscus]|uniref:zinc finger protein 420-like n=1 Tax=Pelobates fuscus TaxID=191477 RepID=UPI002FE4F75D